MPGDLDLALRIRADVRSAVTQLKRVDRTLDQVGSAGRRAGRTASAGLDRMERSAKGLAASLRSIRGGVGAAGGLLAGLGLAAAAREIVQVGVATEGLESRLRVVAGSAGGAAREFEFLRGLAERLGLDFSSVADSFTLFAAAAKDTALEGEAARDIFVSFAEAGRVLNLSVADMEGVFNALQQIISKGTVSAEELRQQLGDRFPGAVNIAARALGVTTEALNKMLENGEVLARDLLPLMAREIRGIYGAEVEAAAENAQSGFRRLGNAIEDAARKAAQSGFVAWLGDLADAAAGAVRNLAGVQVPQSREDRAALLRQQRDELAAAPLTRGGHAGRNARRARSGRLADLDAQIAELETPLDELVARAAETLSDEIVAAEGLTRHALRNQRGRIERARAEFEALSRELEEQAAAQEEAEREPPEPAAREIGDSALARLRKAETALLGDEYERQVAEANEWRDRMLAAVAETDAGYADYAERVAGVHAGQIQQAEEARAKAAEDATERVAAALEGAEIAVLEPLDRQIAAADKWRREMLAAVDQADAGYAAYAERVEAVYMARVNRARDDEAERARDTADKIIQQNQRAAAEAERLRREGLLSTGGGGAALALEDFVVAAEDTGQQVYDAMRNGFQGAEDALVEFVSTGKASFGDLVDSIVADLARIVIRQQIVAPLASALGGLFGGGASAGVGHGGGLAGALRRRRQVSPLVFAGARRLHQGGIAGLRSDEVPAILRRDEGVFTPEQMAALGSPPQNVEVRIVNSGRPAQVAESSAQMDSGRLVVGISIEDIASGGPLDRTMRQTYGLRRRGI